MAALHNEDHFYPDCAYDTNMQNICWQLSGAWFLDPILLAILPTKQLRLLICGVGCCAG